MNAMRAGILCITAALVLVIAGWILELRQAEHCRQLSRQVAAGCFLAEYATAMSVADDPTYRQNNQVFFENLIDAMEHDGYDLQPFAGRDRWDLDNIAVTNRLVAELHYARKPLFHDDWQTALMEVGIEPDVNNPFSIEELQSSARSSYEDWLAEQALLRHSTSTDLVADDWVLLSCAAMALEPDPRLVYLTIASDSLDQVVTIQAPFDADPPQPWLLKGCGPAAVGSPERALSEAEQAAIRTAILADLQNPSSTTRTAEELDLLQRVGITVTESASE